jgi:hypothetical protein
MRRISIDPNNAPTRRNSLGQELDDSAWTTAKVDRPPSRLHLNSVEEFGAVHTKFVGLASQPGAFRRIAA